MKKLLAPILLLFTFSHNAQSPTAVSIPKEPHHHLVLENDYVRVFRVSVPAHESTLLHQHDVPYLYVSLGPADVINAVQDEPEVHLVMADGQLGYSPGHFAHIARNESDAPFNNVTIELLHPQGEPRNLCREVIYGHLSDCKNSDADKPPSESPSKAPPFAIKMDKLFETDEVLVESATLDGKTGFIQSGSQPPQLVIALDNAGVRVDVHGRPSNAVHGGEVLWLPAGNPPAIFNLVEQGSSRVLLIAFKNGNS